MTTLDTIAIKLRSLPPELLDEVDTFVEFLLNRPRKAVEHWPEGYFETVLGSLPDFPAVDDDRAGLDENLDERADDLRFDTNA
jgi:hypothetical protein